MGRDLFSRFIAGSRYTILTGLMTTLLAGASGYLMGRAACAMPTWIGRLVTVLAYVCFVAPSFLLAPRWPNRLLTTALCLLSVLPLFIIALIVLVLGKLTGWTTALALGPLWGVGIAYVIHRANRQDRPASQAGRDNTVRHLAALMASIFAWAVYLHAVLDVLGLGVQPPAPSWGSMLIAQGVSLWPQAMAILGFLIIGTAAFSFSDIVSRQRDGNHILDKREEVSGG
jgi:peptide/nickel transport system permease protein